jgi:hypothetical protein
MHRHRDQVPKLIAEMMKSWDVDDGTVGMHDPCGAAANGTLKAAAATRLGKARRTGAFF